MNSQHLYISQKFDDVYSLDCRDKNLIGGVRLVAVHRWDLWVVKLCLGVYSAHGFSRYVTYSSLIYLVTMAGDVIMWTHFPRSALLFGAGCFCIISASVIQDMKYRLNLWECYMSSPITIACLCFEFWFCCFFCVGFWVYGCLGLRVPDLLSRN